MKAGQLTYRGTVYPWHCDHMGHMNVMWYVGKFDEATWQLFASVGLGPDYLGQHGLGMAAVEQHIEYRRELVAGDLLSIRSRILEVKDKTLTLWHEMINDGSGQLSATARLVGVHMDTAQRKACPFAPAIRSKVLADVEALACQAHSRAGQRTISTPESNT